MRNKEAALKGIEVNGRLIYTADISYRITKSKLMRDVRLLRTYLDGNIPAITANEDEQLRILISRCKENVEIAQDSNFNAVGTSTFIIYLVKFSFIYHGTSVGATAKYQSSLHYLDLHL